MEVCMYGGMHACMYVWMNVHCTHIVRYCNMANRPESYFWETERVALHGTQIHRLTESTLTEHLTDTLLAFHWKQTCLAYAAHFVAESTVSQELDFLLLQSCFNSHSPPGRRLGAWHK